MIGAYIKKKLLTALFMTSSVASAATVKGFDTSVYGFIRASSQYASGGLASFNNINMTAPTHAVAQTRSKDKTSRLGFQTQQTRIGTLLKKEDITAQLEFDFVDFNKSSPTTQMVPRVRLANVAYVWDNQKVVIGQDWDIFAPVNAYTYNYVGNYFLSGNVGFMRQQVQYLKTMGSFELAGAVGLANSNPTVTDGDVETGKSPSYAFRATQKLDKGRIGVSAIYAHLKYTTGKQLSHDAYGGNFFYEQEFSNFGIKAEAYYGMNMANLGLLSIGKGTASQDVREFGGHLTGTFKLGEKLSTFGGFGIAKGDNRSEIAPFAPQGTGLDTSAITSPGIRQNFVSRIGIDYKVTEDLSFLTELSRYETNSKLSDNAYKTKVIGALESGIQLRF
jgi:hypothetical protein